MLIERAAPATLPHLQELLGGVDQICRAAGVGEAFRDELRLVVEEALVNVIKHGFTDREPECLRLALTLAPWEGRPAVRVDLQDRGMPFDPLAVALPDVDAPAEDRQLGGLGVMLIRRLSDLQYYRHDAAHGNCLTIVKYLKACTAD